MCLVIDTCCLSMVFEKNNHKHADFAAVMNWIIQGNGRMIYGGTKYNEELRKARRFLKLVTELSRGGKTVRVANSEVDPIATALKVRVPDVAFDDEHLVALVIASRCHIVCTVDTKAMPYLKRRDLFARYHMKHPKIYRYAAHKDLCCDKHVVTACRG